MPWIFPLMEVFASIHIQDKHSPKLKFNKSPLCSSRIRTEGRILCPWIINISASASYTHRSESRYLLSANLVLDPSASFLSFTGRPVGYADWGFAKHSNDTSLASITKACNEETQSSCKLTMGKFVQINSVRTWWRNTVPLDYRIILTDIPLSFIYTNACTCF